MRSAHTSGLAVSGRLVWLRVVGILHRPLTVPYTFRAAGSVEEDQSAVKVIVARNGSSGGSVEFSQDIMQLIGEHENLLGCEVVLQEQELVSGYWLCCLVMPRMELLCKHWLEQVTHRSVSTASKMMSQLLAGVTYLHSELGLVHWTSPSSECK